MNTLSSPPGRRALTLKVGGDLLSTTAVGERDQMFSALDACAADPPDEVEVDLRGARMVDSVGLNLLVAVIKRVSAWNVRPRILISDANVLRTFQFTRLDSQAEVVRC